MVEVEVILTCIYHHEEAVVESVDEDGADGGGNAMVVVISSSNGGSFYLCFCHKESENGNETYDDVNKILSENVSGNRNVSLNFELNVVNRIFHVLVNEVKMTLKQRMSYVHSSFLV